MLQIVNQSGENVKIKIDRNGILKGRQVTADQENGFRIS